MSTPPAAGPCAPDRGGQACRGLPSTGARNPVVRRPGSRLAATPTTVNALGPTIPGLMKIRVIKKPAQRARKNVPNPFRRGMLARVKKLTVAMTRTQLFSAIAENTALTRRQVADVFEALESMDVKAKPASTSVKVLPLKKLKDMA